MFIRDAARLRGARRAPQGQHYIIQEYIIGVPLYIHYFYSPLTNKLEIMSMDRRYETNVDSLGRIPAAAQEGMDVSPSYVVVGNQPVSLRESMLAEALRMGDDVVRVSKEICGPQGTLRRVLHRDDHHAGHPVLRDGDLRAHRRRDESFHRRLAVFVSQLLRADVDRTPHRPRAQERLADQ